MMQLVLASVVGGNALDLVALSGILSLGFTGANCTIVGPYHVESYAWLGHAASAIR